MRRRPRARPRRSASSAWLWLSAGALAAAAAGSLWLAAQAERRLAALRLGGLGESFSTRVFAAPFVLRDGELASEEAPAARLRRLGYRRVDGAPARGEYSWAPPELLANLRGHRIPGSAQEAGLYRLRREASGAWRVSDEEGRPLEELRLEPEPVADLTGSARVRRDPVAWEDIPPVLRAAVVSAEDKRFWSHRGVDPRAVARALLANLALRPLQGASTITQQLSKNLFLTPRRTLWRKLAEAAFALYLERRLDKERILTLYLNHIYLGQDGPASVAGARAAARYYFSKDVRDLGLAEAALLAGMIRSPGRYDPFRDPAAARARRDQVLRRMREDGAIGPGELSSALAEPVPAARAAGEGDPAAAAYYTAEVVRRLVPRYGGEALYHSGLSVHTAMDPVLQEAAQAAAASSRHQAALVALDPATGDVRALAGGKSFRASQFNRATQAQRQPGSAFKPFVFAAALEEGFTPATALSDRPRAYPGRGRAWRPENYNGVYLGTATARQALARSLNAATLDLAARVGVERIRETAARCGISSPLRADLGLALGSSEVGLLELTAAYAPFAAGGRRSEPRLVTAVLDAEGNILEAPEPVSEKALEPAAAALMTSLLESVVREGTARALPSLGFPHSAAGKTGTTDEGRDAWFVGYTSRLLAGVWTGDDGNLALRLTGAKDALPLWAAFMSAAAAERPPGPLPGSEELVRERVCPESGLRALAGCPRAREELFLPGTEPRRDCELHRAGLGGWLRRLFGRPRG